MRSAHRCLVLVLPALLLSACGDRRAKEDDASPTPSDEVVAPADPAKPEVAATPGPTDVDDTTAAPPGTATTTQGVALGLLIAANEHEVAAAEQAIAKKVTGDVLAFANMMKTDHGKNLADTRALGGAIESADVTAMKSKGAADLAALGTQSGTAYEQAYIDAMVKGHTDVLGLLDGTLIPAATDDKVKAHFTATRAAVAMHLDEAKKLKAGP